MRRLILVAFIAMCAIGTSAEAQVTGNPTYVPPFGSFDKHEFGVTASFPGNAGDAAFEGLFGVDAGAVDILFQGGFIFGAGSGNDDLVLLGTELRYQFISHTQDFPADGALVAGVGARLGNINQAIIPVGLTMGRRLIIEDSEVSIVPFLQPTVIFIAGDGSDVGFAMGLGADFILTRSFNLRVSAGLGEVDGISFSAIWLR